MHTENLHPIRVKRHSPYPSTTVKVIDRSLTLTLLTLLSPVLIIRGAIAIMTQHKLFDRRQMMGAYNKSFTMYQFAGHRRGRSLAILFNLLAGQMSWLGTKADNKHGSGELNPGIFSSKDMQKRIGIITTDEIDEYIIPAKAISYLKLLARTIMVTLFTGARTRPLPRQINLMGVPVSNLTLDEVLQWMIDSVKQEKKRFIPFVNAHCFNMASQNINYRNILRRADKVLPDGSGVRLACRFHGLNLKDNLNGTDLFPHLCCRAANEGISIYLLGAEEGVAQQVANRMITRYPKLIIAGTRNGFFTDEQNDEVINEINRSGAGILLVAMGVPQQEQWLDNNINRLQTQINLAVGGLFDFYSERISRAPLWLRELGMEWSWRLLQEPARMWRRYVLGNPAFILRAMFDSHRHGIIRLLSARKSSAYSRLVWWLKRQLSARIKRLLDVSVAIIALLLLSPLLLLTAILIRIDSPGPIIFRQERVGLRGITFNLIKFRSMYIDAEQRKAELIANNEMVGGVIFKLKNDPRITRIGKFIRRYSIDELPQLWNVLRGDMSLVGPRPALPNEVEQYTISERRRLLAVPGITCIWQVSGRSEIPFEQQVIMDMQYIHHSSIRKDMKLLLQTVPSVISGRGAY